MSAVYVFEELRLPMELLAAALCFLLPFSEKKPRFVLRAVLGYAGFSLAALLFFVIFGDKEHPRLEFLSVFWYSFVALFAGFYARLCFHITRADAMYFTVSSFLTQNIVYCVYHCYIARVLAPTLRLDLPLYALGALAASAAVFVPVYFIFKRPLREAKGELMPQSRQAILALGGVFIAMMICIFFYQGAFERRVSSFDTFAWLSGVVICLFMLVIQYSVIRLSVSLREKSALENMLRSSERYYDMSREQIAIINRKCHDLKHQLRALERAGDEDRAEYIRETRESVDFYSHLVYTDNEALNTILAEKGLVCRERGIAFNCAVDDVDLGFIRLPDLYALLGNAVDNAIEYVTGLEDPEKRSVAVRIERVGSFVGIQAVNPYLGAELSDGRLPETSKSNIHDHGFGLKSIRYLAEKYGGNMELDASGGLFTLQILLPISK